MFQFYSGIQHDHYLSPEVAREHCVTRNKLFCVNILLISPENINFFSCQEEDLGDVPKGDSLQDIAGENL